MSSHLPAPDPRSLVGRVLAGRYRIDAMLGEGGMGTVYRAEHVVMKKPLAVKVLHAGLVGVEEAVERFQREAVAGAHVQHPNVAAAVDFGRLDDGSHFLALEYLDGRDLRGVMASGPMQPARALRIARQLALALCACHTIGIVHRDIKPENVMLLDRDGETDFVKLLDFGIAKVPVAELGPKSSAGVRELTQLGMVYGTPEYMAPEQALGQEIDGRADLYALGVVLYEMLSTWRPFDDSDRATLLARVAAAEPPPLASRMLRPPPPELEALVMRLLAKSAGARFSDAALVVNAIDHVSAALDSAMPEKRMRQPSISEGRRPSRIDPDEDGGFSRAARDKSPKPPGAATVAYGASKARTAMTSLSGRGPDPTTASTPVVFTAVGLLAIAAVVVGATQLRSPQTIVELEQLVNASASTEAPTAGSPTPNGMPSSLAVIPAPASTKASTTELDAAKAGGLPALGPLAQHYPSDPNVLKALLLAHAADRTSYAAAMRVAKRLFEIAPAASNDEEVKQVVLMAANGTPDAESEAFEIMTHMGPAGIDLIYELAIAPNVGKLPKDRAIALLAEPGVLATATPALRIANELRLETSCQRKALFARARDEGDARALHYLKPLQVTTGCGFFHRGDCFGCLGSRKELNEAIEAIEQRAARK